MNTPDRPMLPFLNLDSALSGQHLAHFNHRTYELAGEARSRTILMLEDDDSLADLLRSALESRGFRVNRVRNGAEGLKLILADDYDLILCDMAMPGFPGDMFYRAVERVRPELCKRFLFMTGHAGDPRICEFIRSIRGLMLWKPFQIHELFDGIKVVLEKYESRQLAIR